MGFQQSFLIDWAKAFSLAFPIAFSSVIFVAPAVHQICERLKRNSSTAC